MGFFSKRNKETKEKKLPSFLFGVHDIFPLKKSHDLIVAGVVKGTVHVGDAVYISNPGSDEDGLFLTTVDRITISSKVTVKVATDCIVCLLINNGTMYHIRKSSVLYTREQSAKDVHDTYINTLRDVFVAKKQLELTNAELDELTITDCAEIWRLFSWFHSKVIYEETEEKKRENQKNLERLANALCKKIIQADAIFCIFNKKTGEPHMFSRTVDQGDGTYMCTPPNIHIFSKAYESVMKNALQEEQFEIRKIDNGEKKDGIYNFLGSAFYLNGACGVEVLSRETVINANMLVESPDYSNVKTQNVPVTNPDLMRWMLLIGQFGKPDNDDGELIYKLYYHFLSKKMVKAKFLIPLHSDGEIQQPDVDGKVILIKDTKIKFPTMGGKYDRPAVYMFTDWKRLRMVYDEKWGGLVQSIDGMIDSFDCAINATQYAEAGCYVGKEMFDEMRNLQ